jgi:hypothetical protein
MPRIKADIAERLMATLDAISLEGFNDDPEEMGSGDIERYESEMAHRLSEIRDPELKSVLDRIGGARAAVKWYNVELNKGATALQRSLKERMRNDPETREIVEQVNAYFKSLN